MKKFLARHVGEILAFGLLTFIMSPIGYMLYDMHCEIKKYRDSEVNSNGYSYAHTFRNHSPELKVYVADAIANDGIITGIELDRIYELVRLSKEQEDKKKGDIARYQLRMERFAHLREEDKPQDESIEISSDHSP